MLLLLLAMPLLMLNLLLMLFGFFADGFLSRARRNG